MSINQPKPLSANALRQFILKAERGVFKPIGTFEEFKKDVMEVWKKSKLKKFSLLLAALFSLNSCHNNDAIFLKELKQQNVFLEEQLTQLKNLFKQKADVSAATKAYADVYFKQDSLTSLFLTQLEKINETDIDKKYANYIEKLNSHFTKSCKVPATKVLREDEQYLFLKNDSLLYLIKDVAVKKEIIKKNIFQHHIVVAQLYIGYVGSCYIRYSRPNYFGYRLTIEKNTADFLLNLKCYDNDYVQYFTHLEFISLQRVKINHPYGDNEYSTLKTELTEAYNKKDALMMRTKSLVKGFYRINCNKLSISEIGRLIKEPTYYDFEIN